MWPLKSSCAVTDWRNSHAFILTLYFCWFVLLISLNTILYRLLFKIKARELTRFSTSKARDLNNRLLELYSSSEKTAPSVMIISALSTAGSAESATETEHWSVTPERRIHRFIQATFTSGLQAERRQHDECNTAQQKKSNHHAEENLQRRQPASHAAKKSVRHWINQSAPSAAPSASSRNQTHLLDLSMCRLQIRFFVSSGFLTNCLDPDARAAFIELEMINSYQ